MTKNDKATVFDKIGASVPMNRNAAVVTGGGEHYKSDKQPPVGMLHWDAPPPMKPFRGPPGSFDLTGKSFGRFTVIGMLNMQGGKNRGERWVCKCACGDYEARSPGAIRAALAELHSAEHVGYRCWNCVQANVIKNQYRKQGARPLSDFVDAKARTIEAKSAPDIVADFIAEIADMDDGSIPAQKLIARLQRNGYRIMREPPRVPEGMETDTRRPAPLVHE